MQCGCCYVSGEDAVVGVGHGGWVSIAGGTCGVPGEEGLDRLTIHRHYVLVGPVPVPVRRVLALVW